VSSWTAIGCRRPRRSRPTRASAVPASALALPTYEIRTRRSGDKRSRTCKVSRVNTSAAAEPNGEKLDDVFGDCRKSHRSTVAIGTIREFGNYDGLNGQWVVGCRFAPGESLHAAMSLARVKPSSECCGVRRERHRRLRRVLRHAPPTPLVPTTKIGRRHRRFPAGVVTSACLTGYDLGRSAGRRHIKVFGIPRWPAAPASGGALSWDLSARPYARPCSRTSVRFLAESPRACGRRHRFAEARTSARRSQNRTDAGELREDRALPPSVVWAMPQESSFSGGRRLLLASE